MYKNNDGLKLFYICPSNGLPYMHMALMFIQSGRSERVTYTELRKRFNYIFFANANTTDKITIDWFKF